MVYLQKIGIKAERWSIHPFLTHKQETHAYAFVLFMPTLHTPPQLAQLTAPMIGFSLFHLR